RSDTDTYHIHSVVDDPEWGHWGLSGERDRNNGNTSLQAHGDRVQFTPEKLRSIPFVPAVTWEEVRGEGETPVDATVRLDSSDETPHYSIKLDPTLSRLEVTAIDLTAERTTGHIEIEDGVLKLTKLRARAAGGELAGDATVDFRGDALPLAFNVTSTKL